MKWKQAVYISASIIHSYYCESVDSFFSSRLLCVVTRIPGIIRGCSLRTVTNADGCCVFSGVRTAAKPFFFVSNRLLISVRLIPELRNLFKDLRFSLFLSVSTIAYCDPLPTTLFKTLVKFVMDFTSIVASLTTIRLEHSWLIMAVLSILWSCVLSGFFLDKRTIIHWVRNRFFLMCRDIAYEYPGITTWWHYAWLYPYIGSLRCCLG
jgi:hypothetical protein